MSPDLLELAITHLGNSKALPPHRAPPACRLSSDNITILFWPARFFVRPKPGADLDNLASEYANILQRPASSPAPCPQDLASGISLLAPLTRGARVGTIRPRGIASAP
jgi:hypothetical protein